MTTPEETTMNDEKTLNDTLDGLDAEDQLATLVPSHPSHRSSVTVWTLSNDNPSKTQILDSDMRPIYDVKVDFGLKETVTNMRRINPDGTLGDMFGFLEWHDFLPDKLSFNGGPKVRKSSYFSSAGLGALTFKGPDGRKYTWKGVGTGLQMALHAGDSPNPKLPIAQFQRSRLDHTTTPPTEVYAQLFLTERAMEVQELVLFTFLVLEKGRRTKEASEGNRMSGLKAEAAMGAPGSSGVANAIGDGVGPGNKRRG